MLSRVAESIYWLSRYMERAENYARMLDENFNLSLELPPGKGEQWFPLVLTTGEQERYRAIYGEETGKENVLEYLTYNKENPSSLFSCIFRARENARSVREIISAQTWEHINRLYLYLQNSVREKSEGRFKNYRDFFQEIKTACHLFLGSTDSAMSHDEGWQFGQLGRFLERADMTSRILDMKYYYLLPSVTHVELAIDLLHWTSTLRSAMAYQMFRKVYGKPDSRRIVQFLALDKEFPRSILFCLSGAQEAIHAISGSPSSSFVNRTEKLIGKLKTDLDYSDSTDIFSTGIHEYMDQLQTAFSQIHSAISEDFFATPGTKDDDSIHSTQVQQN